MEKQKTKWKEVVGPYEIRSDPYCICFVYAKSGNFVLKGNWVNIRHDLWARKYGDCIFYRVIYGKGKHRGSWQGTPGITIKRPKIGKRRKYQISVFIGDCNGQPNYLDLTFRRMPRRWLPAFDHTIGGSLPPAQRAFGNSLP